MFTNNSAQYFSVNLYNKIYFKLYQIVHCFRIFICNTLCPKKLEKSLRSCPAYYAIITKYIAPYSFINYAHVHMTFIHYYYMDILEARSTKMFTNMQMLYRLILKNK